MLALPKIVSIGIYNSQVAVKNRTVTRKRKTTMFEIEIPIEDGGASHINDEEAPIRPNMIICAKPGQVRYTRVPFKCYYIHMSINEGDLYDNLMDMPNYIQTDKHKKYLELFKKMLRYYDTALETDEIILHSLILRLIYDLINDSQKLQFREKVKSNNYSVVERVMNYVQENLASDLSLKRIAAYAGFSPVYFHNCFKASTGLTFREYVEEQRIKKAANMLITTDYTLTEIAYECGFSSQSYFSYAFKRKKKVTPREYAKEIFQRYEAGS